MSTVQLPPASSPLFSSALVRGIISLIAGTMTAIGIHRTGVDVTGAVVAGATVSGIAGALLRRFAGVNQV
jgi:hypothetical protein